MHIQADIMRKLFRCRDENVDANGYYYWINVTMFLPTYRYCNYVRWSSSLLTRNDEDRTAYFQTHLIVDSCAQSMDCIAGQTKINKGSIAKLKVYKLFKRKHSEIFDGRWQTDLFIYLFIFLSLPLCPLYSYVSDDSVQCCVYFSNFSLYEMTNFKCWTLTLTIA